MTERFETVIVIDSETAIMAATGIVIETESEIGIGKETVIVIVTVTEIEIVEIVIVIAIVLETVTEIVIGQEIVIDTALNMIAVHPLNVMSAFVTDFLIAKISEVGTRQHTLDLKIVRVYA